MLADLKARAAGVDRKRVYTAAAALLIAGAAGHFMQQTSGGASGPGVMSASIPPISAPKVLPSGPQSDGPQIIAASPDGTVPEILPADGAGEPTAESLAAAPETATPQIVALAPLSTRRPEPKPAIIPEIGTVSTAIYPAPEADPVLEEVTRSASDPLLTITEPAPERSDEGTFASADGSLAMPPATVAAAPEPEVAGCPLDVAGAARPGALLEINVTAPCNSGEAVSFQHAGLAFSEQLGPDGTLALEVPAMTGAARVAVSFADGTERDIEVTIPDFDTIDRIAVVWQGPTGLQLHAFEGGANYDEIGHVWADTPGTPDAATSGSGGFLSMLGSSAGGFAADVYSYPASLTNAGVNPEVSIEAQVMENTCGGEIEGWILRSNPAGAPHAEPLTIKVPGCEAIGEFLVLKNLPVELTLAGR